MSWCMQTPNIKDGEPWFLIKDFHWQQVVTRWIILGHRKTCLTWFDFFVMVFGLLGFCLWHVDWELVHLDLASRIHCAFHGIPVGSPRRPGSWLLSFFGEPTWLVTGQSLTDPVISDWFCTVATFGGISDQSWCALGHCCLDSVACCTSGWRLFIWSVAQVLVLPVFLLPGSIRKFGREPRLSYVSWLQWHLGDIELFFMHW